MTALRRSAAGALLSCIVIFAAAGQVPSGKIETLFTINKRPVTTAEFVYLFRKNHQQKQGEFTEENISRYLDLFIKYKLKVEEARARGMDTTASFRNEFATYRDELLKPYLPDAHMVDSLVALTYARLQEEVRAAHILIKLDPSASPADTLAAYQKISALRNRALAGEDFGTLAARYSEEPRANETKGDLGYFTAMQMVFPFEQAAYLTPVGEISAPVRTQYGYHIVKVLDRQPARGEVEVSHIMIRVQDSQDEERARNTIFDIYDKLQQGMKWEELCLKYSEDANTRDHGGRLRPFGVGGMASAPQFQEMAFALKEPGQISDPVRTPYGWHILRLEQKIPLPTLEEIRPSLTARVRRDTRMSLSKQVLRRKMQSSFGYTEAAAVKERLFGEAAPVLADSSVDADLADAVLFTMEGKGYPVKDFLRYVRSQKGVLTTNAPEEKLQQLFVQYGDEVMLRLMEHKIEAESPDYKWLLKEYYEGILLFEIMEKEVWNKAMEDSVGQLAYFQNHQQDYHAGERVICTIYSTGAAEPLAALKKVIEAGDPDRADVLSKYRIRSDSGAFEKNDRTVLTQIDWKPGLQTASYKGVHYLVDIAALLPPGPETFDEARASVISDYQTFLEDSWISELKRKFGVKVMKRAKKRVFTALTENKNG